MSPVAAPAPSPAAPSAAAGRLPVSVLGLGGYLPSRTISNEELTATFDTSDEWIRSRTGIGQRHVVADDEATSDLAVAAGKAALADAGLGVEDLGAVMVATTTPDHSIPGTAPIVAAELGTEVFAADLNAACSGFVYGLRTAGALAATGSGPVLLIGADALTRVVDWSDRSVAVLFGDGAGAVVLGADPDAELGPFDLGVDGRDPSMLWTQAGGTRVPATPALVTAGADRMTMRGGDVYRHAVRRMTTSAQSVLVSAGLEVADIDLFIGHQANRRILDAVSTRLGVPPERTHLTVERHANTSAASVPLALADARDQGRLRPGDRVLLTAFGAGLTWASCLLRWSGKQHDAATTSSDDGTLL